MPDLFEPKCTFRFVCDKSWNDLELTESRDKRFCKDCERFVFLCENYPQLQACGARGDCVCYLPSDRLDAYVGDLLPPHLWEQ